MTLATEVGALRSRQGYMQWHEISLTSEAQYWVYDAEYHIPGEIYCILSVPACFIASYPKCMAMHGYLTLPSRLLWLCISAGAFLRLCVAGLGDPEWDDPTQEERAAGNPPQLS